MMVQHATVVVPAPGIQQLEWLKLSITHGMSRDLVESGLLTTPEYQGFRYATDGETEILLRFYYASADDSGNIFWKRDAAAAAAQFLADFGVTQARTKDSVNPPPPILDVAGEDPLPSCDMHRYAYFYYGDSFSDRTKLGRVQEAMHGIDHVAGVVTYNELVGYRNFCYAGYSNLLVRMRPEPAPPSGLVITG